MQVKWTMGGLYEYLATDKKIVTIKSALAAEDAAAEIQLTSDDVADPFTVQSADRAMLACVVPSGNMDGLVVGTTYYVDVQLVHDGQPYTILYDIIRPFQQVTKAVS
jgi:hypothetical protein